MPPKLNADGLPKFAEVQSPAPILNGHPEIAVGHAWFFENPGYVPEFLH
jgi:hypothetical protein